MRNVLLLVVLAGLTVLAQNAPRGNLIHGWDTGEFSARAGGPSRNYEIALEPDWRGIRIVTQMKATGIERGREGWETGRLTVTFHGADGKLAGRKYPLQHEALGTTDWKDVDYEYLIPEGAKTMRVGFCNLGRTGVCTFRPPSLTVTRNWVRTPCSAPPPTAAGAEPESLANAPRATSATRLAIDLGGWWRRRPSFPDEAADFLPGPADCWGWELLPNTWGSARAPRATLSPYFEDNEARLASASPARCWYARRFRMPAEAKGRRVELRFTLINTRAVVWVDGARAGVAEFPSGRVDLTPYAKPGVEQTILLDVTAWPLNAKTRDYNAPDRSDEVASSVRMKGVTGDFFLDVSPRGPRILEAWTECDTSAKTLTFAARLEGASTNDAPRLSAALVPPGETAARAFAGAASIDAQGIRRFTVPLPDAKFWDLHTPGNLYRCRVAALDAEGRTLDETTPFAFGFRDVRLRGRELLLNGIPLHVRALYNTTMNNGPEHSCLERARVLLRNAKAAGFNLVIAGNYAMRGGMVSSMEGLLGAADELGMLVSSSLPHIRDFDCALDKPDVAARYRAMTEKTIALFRNHPCVVACGMNHNCTGYGGDQNPMRLDGLHYDDPATRDAVGFEPNNRRNARLAAAIAKEIDSTRTYYHHESGNLGDWYTLNIYLNWAPRQERSDWLEHWSQQGVKPLFFVEWGLPHVASWSSYRGPHFIWTSKGFQTIWASEYAAAILGDAAYEDSEALRRVWRSDMEKWTTGEPFFYNSSLVSALTNLYKGVQAHFAADNWRAHRTWGITAMLPWDQESFLDENWELTSSPVAEQIRRWNAVDCAYIGGADAHTDKTHLYSPGAPIAKTLVILNDRRVAQTVSWTCRFGADARAGEVRVAPGASARVPVSFTAPALPTNAALEAVFGFADGVAQTDRFEIATMPVRVVKPGRPLLLHDPVGLTAREFRRLGIPFTSTNLTARPAGGTHLVVGRGALTPRLLEDVLVPFALRGGRVIVFEQDKTTLESVGFRVQEYGLRTAFPRFVSRGVGTLSADALRDWTGSSTLVPHDFEGRLQALERNDPRSTWSGYSNTRVWRCGTRNAVATVIPEKPTLGDWRALADGGFDLQYAPLLEWRLNDGSVTFCQFDVTGRTASDPGADDLLRRLVAALDVPLEPTTWPLPVGADAHRIGRLRRLPCAIYYDAKRPRTGFGAYIVTSGGTVPEDFAARIAAGATALCVGLTAEEIQRISPVPLSVAQTNGCFFSRLARMPPEFNGLSHAEMAWHGAMDFAAFTDRVPDGNNAFRVVRHGKGRLVFMQVAPWMIDDVRRPYLRTTRRRAEYALSRLLANMGAQCRLERILYADVPEAEDDPYRYIRW